MEAIDLFSILFGITFFGGIVVLMAVNHLKATKHKE